MAEGRNMITVDGNEAAARIAHRLSEVIAIYPITPSSIADDAVDPEQLERPRSWNLPSIRNFMIVYGLISSAFGVGTFLYFAWDPGQMLRSSAADGSSKAPSPSSPSCSSCAPIAPSSEAAPAEPSSSLPSPPPASRLLCHTPLSRDHSGSRWSRLRSWQHSSVSPPST
jgi:hypothetical protein